MWSEPTQRRKHTHRPAPVRTTTLTPDRIRRALHSLLQTLIATAASGFAIALIGAAVSSLSDRTHDGSPPVSLITDRRHGPDTTTTTQQGAPSAILQTSESGEAAFLEAIADSREGLVRRWDRDIAISIDGHVTASDNHVLDTVITQLNRLPIGMAVARVESGGDIQVHSIPKDEWPDPPMEPSRILGYANVWDRSGVVRRAEIHIDSNQPQASRSHTLTHELMHAIGLGHTTCRASTITNSGGRSASWALSEIDLELIRLLYHPALKPGMSPSEVDELVEIVDMDELDCDRIVWKTTQRDGHLLICSQLENPAPCVIATDRMPLLPITDPIGWLDDGYFQWATG